MPVAPETTSAIEAHNAAALSALKRRGPAVWLRPDALSAAAPRAPVITLSDVAEATARLERFQPALRKLFPESGWNGRITSALLDYPHGVGGALLVKADHTLPLTGSIKARGGVYELLCRIERMALADGVLAAGEGYEALATPEAARAFGHRKVVVASTGNLGFSIGLVARAFGLAADVHMSHDAKAWKKDRLLQLGARVVEHDCDYTLTVERARAAAAGSGDDFIDDESSRELLIGYATAADELIGQLSARGIVPTARKPVIVYLPCGVGGAPGGVTFGLKARLGDAVICVFVEPVASACVFAALATEQGAATSVYDLGLDNLTVADGLAVPRASALVLEAVGDQIDAVVAVSDDQMLGWVGRAWREAGLRLEPSAAAALAAIAPFREAMGGRPDIEAATHVAWTTGGSLLPDAEFERLLA
ncbi:MAG: D-serine ammonia-lyase [Phenylobacterium sp.]|uniref:D-serine ammonia-lyase n=1 Tax=Phenylobacterium sp. TaxID=1871053 RepID=UPI00121C9193|nr:D-serine ammonia-lyase [Phenylobacterium sp.]TAJ73892.1 MAG: D-serine ammonia-lyase [Phenylobacterium sp.]